MRYFFYLAILLFLSQANAQNKPIFELVENTRCVPSGGQKLCLVPPFKQARNTMNTFDVRGYSLKTEFQVYADLKCAHTGSSDQIDLTCLGDGFIITSSYSIQKSTKLVKAQSINYTTCAPKYIDTNSDLYKALNTKFGKGSDIPSGTKNYIETINYKNNSTGERLSVDFSSKANFSFILGSIDCGNGGTMSISLSNPLEEQFYYKYVLEIEANLSKGIKSKF
jgi:hypothetical protein